MVFWGGGWGFWGKGPPPPPKLKKSINASLPTNELSSKSHPTGSMLSGKRTSLVIRVLPHHSGRGIWICGKCHNRGGGRSVVLRAPAWPGILLGQMVWGWRLDAVPDPHECHSCSFIIGILFVLREGPELLSGASRPPFVSHLICCIHSHSFHSFTYF